MEQILALAGGDLRNGVRLISTSVHRHPSLPALDALALVVRTSRPLVVPASQRSPVSAVPITGG